MAYKSLSLGLVWPFLFCGFQGGLATRSLLGELEAKYASDGLMIAGVMNRNVMVFPFSGDPFVRSFFGYDLEAAWTTTDGTAVLGYSYFGGVSLPARRLVLIDVNGRVAGVLDREVINVGGMALAADNRAIAFTGKDPLTGETGLFLGRLGSGEIHLVIPLQSREGVPEETSVAWLPGAGGIAFSRDKQIWTYDLASRRTSLLFRGTNPSYSPDGQWIAYRGLNGYAVIASRQGYSEKRMSRGRVYGHIHWSPDSEYLFVDEKVHGVPSQRCPFGYCFVVYRVGDGSRLELQGTDRQDSPFGWLRAPGLVR